jgi:hypothetical protein
VIYRLSLSNSPVLGLENFLPRLATNCSPPDFCLLSSWDYRFNHWCMAEIDSYILIFLVAM